MTSRKAYDDLTVGLVGEHKSTVLWLASRVALAYEATKNDPNKRVQISIVVSAKLAKKLDDLLKIFNVSSRQDALERLIREAHGKHFRK